MSETITSTPELIKPAHPEQDNSNIQNNGETVAYLLPDFSGTGLNLIVDPAKVPNIAKITEETKQTPNLGDMELEPTRLTEDIETALKLEVTDAEILPICTFDKFNEEIFEPYNSVGWLYDDEAIPEGQRRENDLALYGKKKQNGEFVNVTNWLSLRIEGPETRLHDPLLPEYVGALLAREISDADNAPRKVVMEDHSTKHQEKITLLNDEEGFDRASKITEEYHTSDLGEAIQMDRKKFSHRARRLGHLVTSTIEKAIPSSKNGHDDHLLPA